MSIDNNQEYEAELITLIDDEGTEHEFEIIDELENDDGYFMALCPHSARRPKRSCRRR